MLDIFVEFFILKIENFQMWLKDFKERIEQSRFYDIYFK